MSKFYGTPEEQKILRKQQREFQKELRILRKKLTKKNIEKLEQEKVIYGFNTNVRYIKRQIMFQVKIDFLDCVEGNRRLEIVERTLWDIKQSIKDQQKAFNFITGNSVRKTQIRNLGVITNRDKEVNF